MPQKTHKRSYELFYSVLEQYSLIKIEPEAFTFFNK